MQYIGDRMRSSVTPVESNSVVALLAMISAEACSNREDTSSSL
jgi:hypothetical protein